jgi:hypothetical protein
VCATPKRSDGESDNDFTALFLTPATKP